MLSVDDIPETPTTGLYVAAYYTDEAVSALRAFQKRLKLPRPANPNDFHTTIVYSKKPIHWRCEHDVHWPVTPTGWAVWKDRARDKNVLVLLVEAQHLRVRFKLAMDRGATFDFDQYNPHISFSYDVGEDFDPSKLPLPEFNIDIAYERAAVLRD